jgi:AraC family transcriptional regulator
MDSTTADGDRWRASDIRLVDVASGKSFPCGPAGTVLLSSVSLGWRGITVERHRREAEELPEHYVVGHGIALSTGSCPIPFGWKDGSKWRDGKFKPGEFHLVTHGAFNTPRWFQTLDELSLVLDRGFVADVVQDGLPANRIEFEMQRSASDPTIGRYADAFRSELETPSSAGLLYADTLTVGLTLHLLSNYAVAKPKTLRPKGKLNSFQLRSVVDFIQSHLDEDVSVLVLAEQARVSPFHFARQFRATVGLSPHQYVFQQRVQKSVGLIRAGKLPLAQIAVESGFHDQSHLTRAFRKVFGTTPRKFSAGTAHD